MTVTVILFDFVIVLRDIKKNTGSSGTRRMTNLLFVSAVGSS